MVSSDSLILKIYRNKINDTITPTTPKGYATAYPIDIVGSTTPFVSNNVCWAAPSPGVLVTAPESTPTIVESGKLVTK